MSDTKPDDAPEPKGTDAQHADAQAMVAEVGASVNSVFESATLTGDRVGAIAAGLLKVKGMALQAKRQNMLDMLADAVVELVDLMTEGLP